MKIRNLVLSLTLAGMCFNQASAQGTFPPTAASRSIGDSGGDSRPESFQAARNLSDNSVNYAASYDQSVLDSTSYQAEAYGDAEYYDGGYGAELGSCDNSRCSSGLGWFSSESLLWFNKRNYAPPLVNTNDFGVFPNSGAAGTQTAFGGGNGIDFDLIPGFRISGGLYLDDCQKFAIGGRGYGIIPQKSTYDRGSDGSGSPDNPSIGLPFYNLSLNQEDSYLVAYQDNLGPDTSGVVRARSDLDMYGADGSLYMLLSRSGSHRMDLLGGYSFNILKNSVGVDTQVNSFRFPSAGNSTTTNDLFATKNVFNGGHLGIQSTASHSRLSFSTLLKVAFGNMRQTSSVSGFSTVTDSLNNTTGLSAGILTQPSNIGTYSRDRFGFIPELGIKLGLNARENVQFTLGYSMMMWSGVVLAGDQIDNAVDPTQLVFPNASGTRPNSMFKETTFWMQGVDLGVNILF